jgi:hypothetical protein
VALASPKPHAPIHIAESYPWRRRDSSYYAAVGVAKRSRIDVLGTDLLCIIIGAYSQNDLTDVTAPESQFDYATILLVGAFLVRLT